MFLISEETFGDLQIKGATLFKEYFNKPEATRDAFTQDGWFITGACLRAFQFGLAFKSHMHIYIYISVQFSLWKTCLE